MRMDRKTQKDAIKSERALLRKKKFAVFLLVFCFYAGLTVVDSACTEMTRHEGVFTLRSKPVDENHVLVSFLGREAVVDIRWLLDSKIPFPSNIL